MLKIWGFLLTLIVALTAMLRTTVLHCDLFKPYYTYACIILLSVDVFACANFFLAHFLYDLYVVVVVLLVI